jgi:hypothetical protein
MGGHVARKGEKKNAYKFLKEKPKGKKTGVDGDNIKSDYKKIIWNDMSWTRLVQDRGMRRPLVNTEINHRAP